MLPFRFSDMSDTLARYVAEVQKLHAGKKDAPAIDFTPLVNAVTALSRLGPGVREVVRGGAPAPVPRPCRCSRKP